MNFSIKGLSSWAVTLFVLLWIFGVVLAKGVVSTLFAIFTPWSLYLSVEHFAKMFGIL